MVDLSQESVATLYGNQQQPQQGGVPSWVTPAMTQAAQQATPPPPPQDQRLTDTLAQLQGAHRPPLMGAPSTMQGAPLAYQNAVAARARQQAAGNPVHMVHGGAQGQGGAAAGTTDQPLSFGVPTARMLTVKPHDIQTGTDVMVQGLPKVGTEMESAIDEQAEAEGQQTEHEAQRKAGEAGLVRGASLERQKSDAETDAKIEKAHAAWMKSADVDPDHYASSLSTGKRVGLMIAAAMSDMGMGMLKQSGENPIQKIIDQETERDIEGQKSAAAKKHSLYEAATKSGLDEKQAHALVEKATITSGLLGIDASRAEDLGPLSKAKADMARAALHEKLLDANARLYGHVQGGTVAVGGGTWTPAMAKEAVGLYKSSKGEMSIDQARVQVARAYNVPYTGGPAEPGEWGKKEGLQNARSVGVQMHHQHLLGRFDSMLDQIKQARGMLANGWEYGKGDAASNLRSTIAQEYAFLMHGGASEGAVHQILDDMPDFNQSKAHQAISGNSATKWLDQVENQIRAKRAQQEQAGAAIAQGAGFGALQGSEQAAQQSGAKEE